MLFLHHMEQFLEIIHSVQGVGGGASRKILWKFLIWGTPKDIFMSCNAVGISKVSKLRPPPCPVLWALEGHIGIYKKHKNKQEK
jgi:hypothetical protein